MHLCEHPIFKHCIHDRNETKPRYIQNLYQGYHIYSNVILCIITWPPETNVDTKSSFYCLYDHKTHFKLFFSSKCENIETLEL